MSVNPFGERFTSPSLNTLPWSSCHTFCDNIYEQTQQAIMEESLDEICSPLNYKLREMFTT